MRSDGREAPPVHEMIELNSTSKRTFLIEAARFMRSKESGLPFVLRLERTWAGIDVYTYVRHEHEECAVSFIGACWERAQQLNFLKGEAFAISGKFLTRSQETWADVFLTEANERALRRTIDLITIKGADFPSRGVLLLGPPGTGKTLLGRVMMREADDATFLWISARDFYRMGAFGGLDYGFELARACAPSILFIEDVDNWITPQIVDLLKTEMDGIQQASGVLTVLTTNYPERIPDALLDRPGRFHDVLRFDLPGVAVRKLMIDRWLEDLSREQADSLVKQTDGYSGAHVRELCNFVAILRDEHDGQMDVAIQEALTKLQDQRELITAIQLSDSNYRPSRRLTESIARIRARAIAVQASYRYGRRGATVGGGDCCDLDLSAMPTAASAVVLDGRGRVLGTIPVMRAGKVLAERNLTRLQQAHEAMMQAVEHIGAVVADHQSKAKLPEEDTAKNDAEAERDILAGIARKTTEMTASERQQLSERKVLDEIASKTGALSGREPELEQPATESQDDDDEELEQQDDFYGVIRERAAALRSSASRGGSAT